MKIALLLAAPWIPGSVDMTEYLRVLRRMGHDPVMICLDRSEGPAGFEVYAETRTVLQDPAFYLRLKLDAAIAFTWFNNPQIISAMKKAGMRTLIRGDSDGLLSIRDFPAHHIRVRMSGARGIMPRLTGVKHLLQRYLLEYRNEDQYRLDSLDQADVSVLETTAAADNVKAFLIKHNRRDLLDRLKVVPHFVADGFLTGPVAAQRDKAVVAIGRWEDPQKNAPLLAAAISRYLAKPQHKSTRFYLIGPEKGRPEFSSLTARHPQVEFVGPQNPASVRRYLACSRILLSSSRWEGSPVVGNEALAMGATVVGTPIPAFVDICNRGEKRGEFGRVAAGHFPAALSLALETEMDAWEMGGRDPRAISEFWRPQLSSETVVGELVRLLLADDRAAQRPPQLALAN
jgi:glycosyltransferase involved in cell wall biosynthesis